MFNLETFWSGNIWIFELYSQKYLYYHTMTIQTPIKIPLGEEWSLRSTTIIVLALRGSLKSMKIPTFYFSSWERIKFIYLFVIKTLRINNIESTQPFFLYISNLISGMIFYNNCYHERNVYCIKKIIKCHEGYLKCIKIMKEMFSVFLFYNISQFVWFLYCHNKKTSCRLNLIFISKGMYQYILCILCPHHTLSKPTLTIVSRLRMYSKHLQCNRHVDSWMSDPKCFKSCTPFII